MLILLTRDDYHRLWNLLTVARLDQAAQRTLLNRLERVLGVAKPVPAEVLPPETVTLNAHVVLREKHTGEEVRFQLVLPGDSSVEDRKVSVLSPVGTAILGRRAGEEIRCGDLERELAFRIERVARE